MLGCCYGVGALLEEEEVTGNTGGFTRRYPTCRLDGHCQVSVHLMQARRYLLSTLETPRPVPGRRRGPS